MCTSYIRRHISRLPEDKVFTTHEFLSYGARTAVDKALSRLVKLGHIIRVARGVFTRWMSKIPSYLEIAQAKAKAFGKEIVRNVEVHVNERGICDYEGNLQTFFVSGASSSFRANGIIIQLKHIGPRKLGLGHSKVGILLRALWQLGQGQYNRYDMAKKMQSFYRQDKEEFFRLVCWMPSWFTKMCTIRPARGTPALWGNLANS